MSPYLYFLFLFQAGLAFAFTYFVGKLILSSEEEKEGKTRRAFRMLRNIVLGLAVVIPMLMFLAFYKSLPENNSLQLAVMPAIWIFMILMAVTIALTIAMKTNPGKTELK